MYKLNLVDKAAFILCIIGGVNYGFIGLFNINFFTIITGHNTILQRVAYITILLSSINLIYMLVKCSFNFSKNYINKIFRN